MNQNRNASFILDIGFMNLRMKLLKLEKAEQGTRIQAGRAGGRRAVRAHYTRSRLEREGGACSQLGSKKTSLHVIMARPPPSARLRKCSSPQRAFHPNLAEH